MKVPSRRFHILTKQAGSSVTILRVRRMRTHGARAKNEHRNRRLNGDASWPMVEPLMDAVWPDHVMENCLEAHQMGHADLRVLIEAPKDRPKPVWPVIRHLLPHRHLERAQGSSAASGLRPARMPGTRPAGSRSAAIRPCATTKLSGSRSCSAKPHNFAFYQARGWHPSTGGSTPGNRRAHPLRRDGGSYSTSRAPRAQAHRPMRLPW